jgi:alkylation response protein AidB-like acyl-CoA dehydrogenase
VDLQLTSEQLQLRDATRRVLGVRLESLVARLPEPPVHDAQQTLKDAQDLGWLGLSLPASADGLGDFTDLVVVHEELGRGLAPALVTSLNVAGRLLLHSGAPAPLLASLARGERLVVPVLDGTGVSLTASVLNGSLRYVADAASVTHVLVAAGEQLALVALDADGVTVVEEPSSTDVAHGRVAFADVAVENLGSSDAVARVRTEAVVLAAARAVGGGRAVLDRTVEHVRTRHQFDRPIGTFQSVQHQLADVAMALDAAGLAVARAAWAVAASVSSDELAAAAAIAGLAATDAFAQATLTAHQLHGGMGFVLDSPLHLWSARAVADPTVPLTRRELLELLATSTDVPPDGHVVVTPDHRQLVH